MHTKEAELKENNEWLLSLFLDPWQIRSLDRDLGNKIMDEDVPVDKPLKYPIVLYNSDFARHSEAYQNVVSYDFIGPLLDYQKREKK